MHLRCKTILLILITTLSGCDLQNLKPSANTARDLSDLAEINKTAQVAYQNEDWKTAEDILTPLYRDNISSDDSP